MPCALPRLKKRSEFLRAASRGRKAARPGLVLQALANEAGPGLTRLGFTATKKIGNAVARNRAKRRLREAARLTLAAAPPPGWDLVLIAREGTATRPFRQLLGDLAGALRQAGVPLAGAVAPTGEAARAAMPEPAARMATPGEAPNPAPARGEVTTAGPA